MKLLSWRCIHAVKPSEWEDNNQGIIFTDAYQKTLLLLRNALNDPVVQNSVFAKKMQELLTVFDSHPSWTKGLAECLVVLLPQWAQETKNKQERKAIAVLSKKLATLMKGSYRRGEKAIKQSAKKNP
jgi:hypothetical protein